MSKSITVDAAPFLEQLGVEPITSFQKELKIYLKAAKLVKLRKQKLVKAHLMEKRLKKAPLKTSTSPTSALKTSTFVTSKTTQKKKRF